MTTPTGAAVAGGTTRATHDAPATPARGGSPVTTHELPPDGVASRVADANPAFFAISDYSAAEVVGRPSSVCWGGDAADAATVARAYAALRGGEEVEVALPLACRNGGRIGGGWHFVPLADATGRIAHFAATFRFDDGDWQARALAERAAVAETLFASHLDAVYATDVEARLVRANQAAADLLGCPREQVIGRPMHDFVVPEDQRRVAEHFARAVGGQANVVEMWLAGCDGVRRRARVSKTPLVVDGVVIGVYGVAQDLTGSVRAQEALRDSEERYRLLVDEAPECVAVIQDERMVFVNRSGAAMLGPGYTPADVIGRPWREFLDPPIHDERAAMVAEVLAAPVGTSRAFEDRLRWPDGRIVVGEGCMTRVTYRGRPAVQHFAHDVTDRRRVEAERLRSQRMESLGRLAAGVAHDFNNLLAVMLIAVESATLALPAGDELREDLEAAAEAARRGRALTRQLLTFAQRQEGRPRVLELNDVVRGMSDLLRRIAGPGVQLSMGLAPDAGAVVLDPAQVEQVLLNLVTNARDALPGGRGRVAVETAPDDGLLRLSVRDTGVGIAPEVRPHLFEPFYSTKPEGYGLGLATVYGVVTGAGGRVEVESALGEGTTFNLYFPRAASATDN